jgi:hypothetical protein
MEDSLKKYLLHLLTSEELKKQGIGHKWAQIVIEPY